MRYRAVGVVMAVLLAACGSESPPSQSSVPVAAASNLRLVGEPSPDDVAIQFAIETGTCGGEDPPSLGKVQVDEQADAITVTASLTGVRTRSKGEFCAGVGYTVRVPVALGQPLGTRQLLDGSCSPPSRVVRQGEDRQPCTLSEQQKAEEKAIGKWKAFDRGPLSPRGEPQGVWTGKEMIVVGGIAIEAYRSLSDGAAYDPAKDSWRRIPDIPQEVRVRAVAWTGAELFTISQPGAGTSITDAGAVYLYDPAANTWRAASPPPHPFTDPLTYWTGREVVVWAGNGGALYNPSSNAWREIAPIGIAGAAVGTRSKWIAKPGVLAVQGDYDPRDGSARRSTLLLFDPSTNQWRKATDPPGNVSGFAGAVVVGTTVVYDSQDPNAQAALAYDAAGDSWRKIDAAPRDRDSGTGYFTGVDLGGRGVVRIGSTTKPLGILDIKTGQWSHAASPGRLPSPDGVLLWTGRDVLLWGQGSPVAPGDLNAAWKWSPS